MFDVCSTIERVVGHENSDQSDTRHHSTLDTPTPAQLLVYSETGTRNDMGLMSTLPRC